MKLDVNSPGYVIGFATAVSAVFTAAVVSVRVATASRIERNEALRERKALVEAFALGDPAQLSDDQIDRLVEGHVRREEPIRDPDTGRAFRWFSAEAGVAFEFSGNGFWAPISGLIALTPDLNRVVGIVFLDHKETPGLGGRITERGFQARFRGIDVSPPKGDGRYLYIEKDRPDSPQDPRWGRTVDAITGATQTSRAVARFLNRDIEHFRRAMAAK